MSILQEQNRPNTPAAAPALPKFEARKVYKQRLTVGIPKLELGNETKAMRFRLLGVCQFREIAESIRNHCYEFRLSLESDSTVVSQQNRYPAFEFQLPWRPHRTGLVPFYHDKDRGL